MTEHRLTAPFPWFGGKRKVADIVWQALGDVYHYVEPFAGSLAVLLGRPTDPRLEIVNDLDLYISNFWRALQSAPDEVAYYANNPINEADLTARHIWLVNQGAERISRLQGDPDYYDAQVAGWWVWGICCWIGGGWCAGTGPWGSVDGRLVNLKETDGSARGPSKRIVHLGTAGQGINRLRVHPGQGVSKQIVHLGGERGVNRKRVSADGRGRGVNRKSVHDNPISKGTATGEAEIAAYLNALAERLRYVRVCCGDWARVVTPGALTHGKQVGIFLDPPYDVTMRDAGIYTTDKEHGDISQSVREWCIANGDNPRYRIVLAGYEGEHDMPDSWSVYAWSANAAYQSSRGGSANAVNRHKERLWLSPHCLTQKELF